MNKRNPILPGCMPIKQKEIKPSDVLQPYIEVFWEGDFNRFSQQKLDFRVAPNGFVELIIHLSDMHCHLPEKHRWTSSPDFTIIGLFTHPYEVRFREYVRVFGIRFKPEGLYNLFGVPASEFSESYEDMELVLGRNFREYSRRIREAPGTGERKRLTEEYLLKKLYNSTRELTYLNHAAEMIRLSHDFDKIEELPAKVFISQRQLEREFKRKIGVTPKMYMRIARLNEVYQKLEQNKPLEFTKVAFDCGYSDQAHFIRDFKSFMGVKPTLFVREKDRFIVNPPVDDSPAVYAS